MEKRGRYPKEFKIEAIRLLQAGDKKPAQIALELGIKRTLLYRWKDQFEIQGEEVFSGKPGPKKNNQQSELARLKKENASLREERDILKKAAAYFARDLK